MTETSEAVAEAMRRPGASPPPAEDAARSVTTWRGWSLLGGIAAVIAILCGFALPFAPVSINEPAVSWPRDPARPESTLLQLTAYRPLALDVRFSCDVARLAPIGATTADPRGIVLSTALPALPTAGKIGMIATVQDGRLTIRAHDEVLVNEPLPAGPCEYHITGTSNGEPSFVRPPDPNHPILPDLQQFAQPGNAHLTITRDATQLVSRDVTQLPDVDLLATTVPPLPPALAGQLSVSLRVNDEFSSSPAPLKVVLIVVTVVALAAALAVLLLTDRTVARVPSRRRPRWPRLVDIVVPAVIVLWMFVAPATDDDGYYAAMAHNAAVSGGVGNYYQLYDQSFVPFTWFYQALGAWQQLVGLAPAAQRIPAAVFGILTWIVIRRVAVAALHEWAPARSLVRTLAHAVLAVTFLAWWIPYDMGVRPETVVALCSASTMLAVLAAHRRKRLAFAWLAAAVAGLGFVAHPTGFTLFAPLLAGIPLLWPLLRVPGPWWRTGLRVVTTASAGMVAPLVAFSDGALRDFLRGQLLFLSIQAQDGWTSEYQRYFFLLSQISMGNYAKRAAVLACVLGLVWFAVLAASARLRRVALPTPMWLAGSTTSLAFALLWLTPSKWSHHFGALAGVGSAFLALFLVMALPLTRDVLSRDPDAEPDRPRRIPAGVVAAAAVSTVLVVALAWHGPNDWPYAWLAGVRRPYLPPAVAQIPLDSLLVWFGVFALVTAALALWARRRRGSRDLRTAMLRAVPLVLVCSLAGNVGYTILTFGVAAARHAPPEAIWSDPTGSHCTAAGAIRVADPGSARPLPAVQGLPAPPPPDRFLPGSGYYLGNPPQGTGSVDVWGSLADLDGTSPERNTGSMTTRWYGLPREVEQDSAVTLHAAGTLTDGNVLRAEYGRRTGDDVAPVGQQSFTDPDRGAIWRTFVLTPPPDADVVRIAAVDATAGLHGWLAFTAPSLAKVVSLTQLVPPDAPVALGWQIAFGFPCQRQPVVDNGITESVRYGVIYGNVDAPLSGFGDGVWQAFRGGLFAQVLRSHAATEVAVVGPVDPHLYVYSFSSELARSAYTVSVTSRTVAGASTATGSPA
ncbi:MAG: arabinosyltransferase [Pseudonocardia sp.]|nr:arabinosyltransferase [Pseudonocardia sp.]